MTRNRNMDDPAVQEKIRRGHHEYVPGDGKHGTYVERQYLSPQEYPKVMDRTPPPVRDDPRFTSDEEFQNAVKAWDNKIAKSIVNNKDEEDAWTAARGRNLTTARKGGQATADKAAARNKPGKTKVTKAA